MKTALLLVVGIMFLNCGGNSSRDHSILNNTTTTGTELFSDQAVVRYAQNFSVIYQGNYKVVHLHYESLSRSYKVDEKWILVQRGTPKPELTGELERAQVIEIPIQSLAVNNKAEMIRLRDLGALDKVVAVGGTDIYDDSVYQYLLSKKIPVIGYGADSPQQDEILLSINPDTYLFFSTEARGLELIRKQKQLGIKAIPHLAWSEPFFMAKVEWIKFTALFFNLEREAETIVERIRSNSEELKKKVEAQGDKRTAFMTFHPAGAYDWWAHRNDYYASLLTASGGKNVLQDNGPTHYVPMNNEELLKMAHEAEFWFGNSEDDMRWPAVSYLEEFQSYQKDRVFHYNKRSIPSRNAYDWQELAVARPDLVMEDIASILYPEVLPNHTLLFFEKVKLTKRK
jgi:iron complex transport system substrate-binding protein